MTTRIALLLLMVALGLGAVACGGGDEEGATATDTTTAEETTTDEQTVAAGQAVFVANCGSCHTLADAGTGGAVGPNLDSLAPSADRVESQVRNGGGAMPAFEGVLTDEEIAEVSAYVAAAAGG